MMEKKTIYLLIGPKGSGKSFIGSLMNETFSIKFVRVEDWAKKVRKRRNADNGSYVKEVFQTIEKGIRKELLKHPKIVFESTGLTIYFDQMSQNLKKDFEVITIGIKAEINLCLERVKTRDQSIHINIPDEMVDTINQQVLQKNKKTDFSICNEDKKEHQLRNELALILQS